MPVQSIPNEVFDGQYDFSGGCVMVGDPPENGYRYGKNIVIRDRRAVTRPGIRRAFRRNASGFRTAFYFNEDNAKFNDATHTGFWFPFDFVGSAWGTIQGVGTFRFLADGQLRTIIVSGGRVYAQGEGGYVVEVPVSGDTLTTTETVDFIQANQYLLMLRDEDEPILQWDGGSGGFAACPAGTPQSIVGSASGTYMAGRVFLIRDRDDIYVSDVSRPFNYDYVYQYFSIRRGDGDELVAVYPFLNDMAVCFKRKAISAMIRVNSVVQSGTKYSNYVGIISVAENIGCVAQECVVTYGNRMAFLSYNGINYIERNDEGNINVSQVPLSNPIQPLIDRINWQYASVACAGTAGNYLFFAVPMDGATYNNKVIVYDLLANNGQGAWLGLWESEHLQPVKFIAIDQSMYFLDRDGTLRVMFTSDPWDSDEPFVDTDDYSATVQYLPGDHVLYTVNGTDTIFECIEQSSGNLPTNTTYWEEVTDPQNLYKIETELQTRFYRHNDKESPKRCGITEITYRHQDPSLTVEMEAENYSTRETLFSAKEYDRTVYDINFAAAWDATNFNLDFRNQGRQDYAVFLDALIIPTLNAATSPGVMLFSMASAGGDVFFGGSFADESATLYRTDDAGDTWVNVGLTGLPTFYSLVYAGSNVLVGSDSSDSSMIGKVGRSTDRGITWSTVTVLTGLTLPHLCTDGNGVVWGMENSTLCRSNDYGATWQIVSTSFPGSSQLSLVYAGNNVLLVSGNSASLYRSSDAGVTWSAVAWGLSVSYTSLYSDGSGVVFACADTGAIYRSVDYGETWQLWYSGSAIFGVGAVSTQRMMVYDFTTYRRSDSGLVMSSTGIDLNVWTPHSLRFIPRLNNSRGFALRVTNTKGKLGIQSIVAAADLEQHARRNR